MPRLRPLSLVVLAMLGGLGCDHEPENGDYRLIANPLFKDTCGVAEPDNTIARLNLHRTGTFLIMTLEFESMVLRGYYFDQSEGFSVDGASLNVATDVRGQPCVVDWIGVHLQGEADSATQFSGGFRTEYLTTASDACSCELDADFTATHE